MRALIRFALPAVFALVLGFLLGTASSTHFGSTDLANALRAADFNNRLTMLRVVRKKAPTAEEIPSMEISAVVVLSNVQFDKVTKESSAGAVLLKSAEYLLAYRRDFPKSEFDPNKHPELAKLISWAEHR